MSNDMFNKMVNEVMGSNANEEIAEKEPIEIEEKVEAEKAESLPAETEKIVEDAIEEQKKAVEPIVEQPTTENAYTPNFKYKVKDKEYELEEKARKYIKAKEDEEFFRDVYTKITGLDEIKSQRDKLREDHALLSKEKQSLSTKAQSLDYLENTLASGRYDEFMTTLQRAGLNGKELVRFAQSVAGALEKSPDQIERERLEYDKQRLEYEKSTYSSSVTQEQENLKQQLFETRVEMAISRPEVAEVAKQYNEKYGEGISKKGAFIDEVAKEGMLYFQQTGEVGDPATIVGNVAKKIGLFLQPAAPQTSSAAIPTKTKIIVNNANKNLPNVGTGTNISPIGKSNITIDQMEKHFEKELARRR